MLLLIAFEYLLKYLIHQSERMIIFTVYFQIPFVIQNTEYTFFTVYFQTSFVIQDTGYSFDPVGSNFLQNNVRKQTNKSVSNCGKVPKKTLVHNKTEHKMVNLEN